MIFEAIEYLKVLFPPYLWTILQVLAILVGTQTMVWLTKSLIKPGCGKTLTRLALVAPTLIWLFAIGVLLYTLGMDLNSITQLLIAGGLVIGLVITPAGSNAIAGLLNLWNDVFRIGEVLEVDGIMGRVTSVGLMSVRLRTIDGTYYDVPNKVLFESVVHNFDRFKFYRIIVEVHVDDPNYSLHKTKQVLSAVVKEDRWNKVDDDGNALKAEVRLVRIDPASMVFHAIAWIDDPLLVEQEKSALLETCQDALDKAGISTGQTSNISGGLRLQRLEGYLMLPQSKNALLATSPRATS